MWAHRVAIGNLRLVYVITTDKLLEYPDGRSRVAYIGTTKNGAARVSQSAAYWADWLFRQRGIYEFWVRIVTCTPRRRVKSWRKLERALILMFRATYGAVPICNTQGKNTTWTDEKDYFSETRLKTILDELR